MTSDIDNWLDDLLNKYVSNYNLDELGFRESGQAKVKQAKFERNRLVALNRTRLKKIKRK